MRESDDSLGAGETLRVPKSVRYGSSRPPSSANMPTITLRSRQEASRSPPGALLHFHRRVSFVRDRQPYDGASGLARYPFFAALSGYRTPHAGICFSRNVGAHRCGAMASS